jgi:tetratricopeptide (TPR) repeat protein/transglutaminase-like putative cysteine protease
MKRAGWLFFGSALAWSAPALAGEEPLYRPAPDWVEVTQLPADLSGPPLLLLDNQQRIEEGRLTEYLDRAIRVDNPQMLQGAGTVQARWLPDKGDLVIHRVEILRGGETIDVLAGGTRFDVLRRELDLENRMIDGSYTATLPIPGLRVGDVLRVAYTTTTSDQALKQEVQAIQPLFAAPVEAKQARIRISWPEGTDVRWRATQGVQLPEPEVRDGFVTVGVDLPLAKREDVPRDAPVRYRMPPLLQASTFADWAEVSRVMAPLYRTEGTIAAGSPIAQQVAAIEAAHAEPLGRAVAALRLVQDEITYLLNGLQGGNYIPQSPAETWEKRYGDCKAKSLLLLAMLREMGIEAEATVVASSTGDAVPDLLPMPAAFDHVIVRATIDGKTYWLDGTTSGASMATVDQTPPFVTALPLRLAGADLIPIELRPPQGYDLDATFRFDHRAGLDVPTIYEAEFVLSGAGAAPFRGVIDQVSEEVRTEFVRGFAAAAMGETQVVDSEIAFDAASNRATIKMKGLMASPWVWERGKGNRPFNLVSDDFEFRPDRTRRAWQEIPVALPGPMSQRYRITALLPESSEPYEIEGKTELEAEVAGVRMGREAALDGTTVSITDWIAWPGGELATDQLASERTRASRLGPLQLKVRAPGDVPRRFDFAGARDRSALAPIEQAYAKLIAEHPDEIQHYENRAQFRAMTFDRPGALADFGKVIELDPGAWAYSQRANLLLEEGRLEDALADAEQAFELDPTVGMALFKADILSFLGRVDDAIALIEEQSGTPEEQRSIAMALSDLDALSGRKEQGLQRIDDLLYERPGDPTMLNAKCWYQATWNITDGLAEACTQAVELADWAPPVLDSRAMGYFRLGRYEDALKDLNAALSASPELNPTLLMRGVVRRAMGDRGGQEDIRAALAREPSLELLYARFGIDVG